MSPGVDASLFDGFFDDAAIFPPGNVPMDVAVAAHCDRRASPAGRFSGPFVCSGVRLDELANALGVGPLDVALVTTAAGVVADLRTLAGHSSLRLAMIEIRCDDVVVALPELPTEVSVFYEVPPHGLASIPDGAGHKLRMGGESPAAFPIAAEVAATIASDVAAGRSLKMTAGLHRAVRHTDPVTGHEHHGFLNVIAAVDACLRSADIPTMTAILEDRDTARVAAMVRGLGSGADDVRTHFRSIGTCSTDEPLADLRMLDLLPKDHS